MIERLTKEMIYQEFEVAIAGIDFSDNPEIVQVFLTYFAAGALWAQSQLVPEEVWTPKTPDEIQIFMQKVDASDKKEH